MESSREKAEERPKYKLKSLKHKEEETIKLSKESTDDMDLNIKAVKNIFSGHSAEISTDKKNKSLIIDEIAVNLFFYYILYF